MVHTIFDRHFKKSQRLRRERIAERCRELCRDCNSTARRHPRGQMNELKTEADHGQIITVLVSAAAATWKGQPATVVHLLFVVVQLGARCAYIHFFHVDGHHSLRIFGAVDPRPAQATSRALCSRRSCAFGSVAGQLHLTWHSSPQTVLSVVADEIVFRGIAAGRCRLPQTCLIRHTRCAIRYCCSMSSFTQLASRNDTREIPADKTNFKASLRTYLPLIHAHQSTQTVTDTHCQRRSAETVSRTLMGPVTP